MLNIVSDQSGKFNFFQNICLLNIGLMILRFFTAIFLLIGLPSGILSQSLADGYDRWIAPHIMEGLLSYEQASISKDQIISLQSLIAEADMTSMSDADQKAFYINAYNVIVIAEILKFYPTRSVMDDGRFFSRKHTIGNNKVSLDQLEKSILNPGEDPRIHLALVCGAMSCPPLPSKALRGDELDRQLDEISSNALNYHRILKERENGLDISQIFRWYVHDFGDIDDFIKHYRPDLSDKASNKSYLEYNWILNDINNANIEDHPGRDIRYFSSYLYGSGQYEWSIFNNYFSELRIDDTRSNFFTSFIRYTYGYNKRINFMLDLKFRSVTTGDQTVIGRWEALKFGSEGSTIIDGEEVSFRNIGVSAIIPRIKYQPFNELPNLSVQHAIAIPTNYGESGGFLDWGSPSIYNDLLYDIPVGAKSSIYLQASLWLENIGSAFFRSADGYYQFSVPFTFIYQYFPSRKTTIYSLVNVAPQWGYAVSNGGDTVDVISDGYQQLGIGIKQYVSESFQVELLYSKFFTAREGSEASTYNLGIRYFGW